MAATDLVQDNSCMYTDKAMNNSASYDEEIFGTCEISLNVYELVEETDYFRIFATIFLLVSWLFLVVKSAFDAAEAAVDAESVNDATQTEGNRDSHCGHEITNALDLSRPTTDRTSVQQQVPVGAGSDVTSRPVRSSAVDKRRRQRTTDVIAAVDSSPDAESFADDEESENSALSSDQKPEEVEKEEEDEGEEKEADVGEEEEEKTNRSKRPPPPSLRYSRKYTKDAGRRIDDDDDQLNDPDYRSFFLYPGTQEPHDKRLQRSLMSPSGQKARSTADVPSKELSSRTPVNLRSTDSSQESLPVVRSPSEKDLDTFNVVKRLSSSSPKSAILKGSQYTPQVSSADELTAWNTAGSKFSVTSTDQDRKEDDQGGKGRSPRHSIIESLNAKLLEQLTSDLMGRLEAQEVSEQRLRDELEIQVKVRRDAERCYADVVQQVKRFGLAWGGVLQEEAAASAAIKKSEN